MWSWLVETKLYLPFNWISKSKFEAEYPQITMAKLLLPNTKTFTSFSKICILNVYERSLLPFIKGFIECHVP